MKWALIIIFLVSFSCSHQKAKRYPSSIKRGCGDIIRVILDERKKRAQGYLIAEAKVSLKSAEQNWKTLENDPDVLDIIGRDLEGNRQEMALMSMAILKREYPNESISELGFRYNSLKKLCTGP